MDRIYYKSKNGKKSGPYTIDQLKTIGNLFKDDLIWYEGLGDWTIASEIEELQQYAISSPPMTEEDKTKLLKKSIFKKAVKKSIYIYLIFSIILGIFAGILEYYKFHKFIKETTDRAYNAPSNTYRPSDIFVRKSNGKRVTRWPHYMVGWNKNEQEHRHYTGTKNIIFFRPYKAIFNYSNLSYKEQKSIPTICFNFTLSALISNLILLLLLVPIIYYELPQKSIAFIKHSKE